MGQQRVINVCVIHRDRFWREVIDRALGRIRDIRVLDRVGIRDPGGLTERIGKTRPDVVLVDLGSPERRGLAYTKQLLRRNSDLRILMIGIPNRDTEIIAAIQAGAKGFLTQDEGHNKLVSTIRALGSGQTACSPRIIELLFSQLAKCTQTTDLSQVNGTDDPRLTPRELQIMALVEEGLSNKDIARQLSIENQTVKNHVHHILVKLSLRRRTEVARYVRQHDLRYQGTSTVKAGT